MGVGLGDVDRLPERVARPDPDAEFELEIEARARAKARSVGVGRLALPARAADLGAGDPHRRGAAVITDRHMLVVRQQRLIGAELLADGFGVMDAGIEIGVVADPRRQVQRAVDGVAQRAVDAAVGVGVQQCEQRPAQRAAWDRPQRQQRVKRRADRGFGGAQRVALEQVERGAEIDDLVADRDPAAWRAAVGENAERQVLQRKLGMPIGAGDTAGGGGGVGLVEDHMSCAFGKPAHAAS